MTRVRLTVLAVVGLAAFCAVFVLVDQTYYEFVSARFPPVGSSAALATLWGLVSRGHVILLAVPLVVWRPRFFGFHMGRTRERIPLLLVMLAVNCGVVAGYLWLTGGGTPYSGNQWIFTETIIVPVVEETLWRGVVFSVLLAMLERVHPERTATHLTVWLSGIVFGTLHAANALAGVPVTFVAVQTLSAMVWGVMYGYAAPRRTASTRRCSCTRP